MADLTRFELPQRKVLATAPPSSARISCSTPPRPYGLLPSTSASAMSASVETGVVGGTSATNSGTNSNDFPQPDETATHGLAAVRWTRKGISLTSSEQRASAQKSDRGGYAITCSGCMPTSQVCAPWPLANTQVNIGLATTQPQLPSTYAPKEGRSSSHVTAIQPYALLLTRAPGCCPR